MFDDWDNDEVDKLGFISSCECTGLIPALPHSEYEWESYQSLYSTELSAAIKPRKDNPKTP